MKGFYVNRSVSGSDFDSSSFALDFHHILYDEKCIAEKEVLTMSHERKKKKKQLLGIP